MALNLQHVFKSVPETARLFGVVGWPLSHTLSPAMHNAALQALGIDAVYRAIPVPPEEWHFFLTQAKLLPLEGYNVTIPHKELLLRKGSHPMPWDASRCAAVGAVNTVARGPKGWEAHNTDVAGLQDDLKAQGVSLGAGPAVVLGAGGAARAAVAALVGASHAPKKIWVLNRTEDRAAALAQDFSGGPVDVQGVNISLAEEALKGAALLINATSAGLSPEDGSPVDPKNLHAGMTVYDMIYHRETALLKAAREAKAVALNGLGMLVHQGARAFEIWFNRRPPVDVMRRAALEELEKRRPS